MVCVLTFLKRSARVWLLHDAVVHTLVLSGYYSITLGIMSMTTVLGSVSDFIVQDGCSAVPRGKPIVAYFAIFAWL